MEFEIIILIFKLSYTFYELSYRIPIFEFSYRFWIFILIFWILIPIFEFSYRFLNYHTDFLNYHTDFFSIVVLVLKLGKLKPKQNNGCESFWNTSRDCNFQRISTKHISYTFTPHYNGSKSNGVKMMQHQKK